MSETLGVYLTDHLGGSVHAVEILKNIGEEHRGTQLGQFAGELLREIEADRRVLQGLAERVGASAGLKEAAAWLGEKVSRAKLRHDAGNGLGTVEALEMVELGIQGKWALWRTLSRLADKDARLQGVDYGTLIARASTQRADVELQRLEVARATFQPTERRSMGPRRGNGYTKRRGMNPAGRAALWAVGLTALYMTAKSARD